MAPISFVPPALSLAVAGYWANLLRRYPNEWPRGVEMLPFRRTPRLVAVLRLVAGLATAMLTLVVALQAT